jgi:hypothetical protein
MGGVDEEDLELNGENIGLELESESADMVTFEEGLWPTR